MSFNIIATELFEKKIKRLAKKHKSLKADLLVVIEQLEDNPTLGTPIGKECYKIRIAIPSKNKGKNGGARIISFVKIIDETIFLLSIYNKGEKDTISDKEIEALLKDYI